MQCYKCGKEMEREKGLPVVRGISVDFYVERYRTDETVRYNNLQLGKYSDGNGECHVAICYECYIDGLFHM